MNSLTKQQEIRQEPEERYVSKTQGNNFDCSYFCCGNAIHGSDQTNAFNCIHCDYTTQPYTVSYTSSFPVADSRTFPYAVSHTFSNSVSYAVAKSHTCTDSAAGMHQPTRIA